MRRSISASFSAGWFLWLTSDRFPCNSSSGDNTPTHNPHPLTAMAKRSVIESLHVNAQMVASNEEVFTEDFTVHGIYFGEGDPEAGGQHWNFTRSLGDDDEGVCTVKEIQEFTVHEGITSFEMSRTSVVCDFDSDAAQRTGVRRLTIAYEIDDATWTDLASQAKLVFTDMAHFKLTPT